MSRGIRDRLHVNTFHPADVDLALAKGLGVETEAFLWPMPEADFALRLREETERLQGIRRRALHGTGVNRDVETHVQTPDRTLAALYRQSLEAANALGASRAVFHSFFVRSMMSEDHYLDRACPLWREALEALPQGAILCLENFVDDRPEPMLRLWERMGDARFGLCLDVGHANCNGVVPVEAWIRTLGPAICHVHLHNNDGDRDAHAPLDRGGMDMERVLTLLEAHAQAPTYTLECDAASGLAWLEKRGWA